MYRKFKEMVLGLLVHVTPSIFFRRILRSEFLTLLPTCQDGVENRDKVYFPKVNTVFYKEEVRAAEKILNSTTEKNNIMAFCFSCTL